MKRSMEAYYFGFAATGVDKIDKILSAIACAGKACHHTQNWADEETFSAPDDHTGASPVEWIKNAANEAAEAFSSTHVIETHDWLCGCAHWNGCNLATCARCGRTPGA